MKGKLYLSLVIVALLCLVAWTGYGQGQRSSPGRQTWEYLVVDAYSDPESAQQALNRYGTQGWELVVRGGDYYYFKRAR
jgi:hypothetical protein